MKLITQQRYHSESYDRCFEVMFTETSDKGADDGGGVFGCAFSCRAAESGCFGRWNRIALIEGDSAEFLSYDRKGISVDYVFISQIIWPARSTTKAILTVVFWRNQVTVGIVGI